MFTQQDLLKISQQNIGLRLTHNHDEAKLGGFGDAIPLSHLSGCKDIIEFITLSCLNAKQYNDRLITIYECYKNSDINKTDCLPRLILSYAARFNIGDSQERLRCIKNDWSTENLFKARVIKIRMLEEHQLVSYYNASQFFMPLDLVINRLPTLAQELTRNFNEKLTLRLKLNWEAYATSSDMDYLLLTSSESCRYTGGRDFNNYPMGKAGNGSFRASDVRYCFPFLGRESRTQEEEKNIRERIVVVIKNYIHRDVSQSYQTVAPNVLSIQESVVVHNGFVSNSVVQQHNDTNLSVNTLSIPTVSSVAPTPHNCRGTVLPARAEYVSSFWLNCMAGSVLVALGIMFFNKQSDAFKYVSTDPGLSTICGLAIGFFVYRTCNPSEKYSRNRSLDAGAAVIREVQSPTHP